MRCNTCRYLYTKLLLSKCEEAQPFPGVFCTTYKKYDGHTLLQGTIQGALPWFDDGLHKVAIMLWSRSWQIDQLVEAAAKLRRVRTFCIGVGA